MALSYRKYPNIEAIQPKLVTSSLIDPNKILGLHQGSNSFANLIICVAEAWYLESIKETAKDNRAAIIENWWRNYNSFQLGQAWCELFANAVIDDAIKTCGAENKYPKGNSQVKIYKTSSGGAVPYNWELSAQEISNNNLKITNDVIFGNAFRASLYLQNLRGVSVGKTPLPGSRFFRYSAGNASGHAGIVIAILDGYFYTIEGNVVIDNNTLDEGVGMYRYPLSAAQNTLTGFEFFDFSKYPSNYGKPECEVKQNTAYVYVGLDGKRKMRDCFKPPENPDKPKEDPDKPKEDPDKPKEDKPEEPPEIKKDCVPAEFKLLPNDTQVQKQKKCETITKVIIPSKGILQNTIEMKNQLVAWDITQFNGAEVKGREKDRNGAALWYGLNKYNQDTGKATGFGMFKDRVGNIYYVLDENNKQSEQLLVSGLLGVTLPDNFVEKISGLNEKRLTRSLSDTCYRLRNQINYFGIDVRATKLDEGTKFNNSDALKIGYINSTNGIFNNDGLWNFNDGQGSRSDFYNWQENLGLDFDGVKYNYQIPLKNIYANQQLFGAGAGRGYIDLYKLIEILETTVVDKKQGIKLNNPIVIVIRKPSPKPNLISQDFITALNIVGALGAVVGVPLPLGAILNAATFAQNLETSIKSGVSINNINQIVTSATRFAENIMPDTIKGINVEIEKQKKELANMLGLGASANMSLQELLGLQTNGSTIQAINKVINDIKALGEDGQLGQYLATAKKTFNQMASGNFSSAENIIGIDGLQLQKYINSIDTLGSKFIPIDITRIKQGVKFADTLKSFTNVKSEVFSAYVLNKLNNDKTFFDNASSLFDITNSPLIQELMISGTASKTIGLFPQSPQLASLLVAQKNKTLNDFDITAEKISSIQDQKASLIAGSLGYDIKVCDIFADETLKSFKKQAEEYARAKIPFVLPPTLDPDVAECYKFEIQSTVGGDIIHCPDGWNYDPKTNRCYNETVKVGFDVGIKTGGEVSVNVERIIPKCIQQSFGSYVFYYGGIPLVAVPTADNRWIASYGGKNYVIDTVNCKLLGLVESTTKPNDPPVGAVQIPLPKCIRIVNDKYFYNPVYIGLNDNIIPQEITNQFVNTKNPIGGFNPDLVNAIGGVVGINPQTELTNFVSNNPTVSSAISTAKSANDLINTFSTQTSSPTGSPTGSPISVSPTGSPISLNPITTQSNVSSVVTNPNLAVSTPGGATQNLQVVQSQDEEAFYINGKWYVIRNGKYVELVDCRVKQAEVFRCGITEVDGELILNKNGVKYKIIRNFDNEYYIFVNGNYYVLGQDCEPIIPKPSNKECQECEILVEKERQNRIKLENAFNNMQISNDKTIKELINSVNKQTQKSLELEKQLILKSGEVYSGDNEAKYNELTRQLQNERDRINQLTRLLQENKTSGSQNNYDSVIREIQNALTQEKQRSQNLEQKIIQLEQQKSSDYFGNIDKNNGGSNTNYSNDYNNYGGNNYSYSTEEKLPRCIITENGKYYFVGTVKNEKMQLMAVKTMNGWVANYQNSYYLIDSTNCTLMIGNTKTQTFTGECNDCVQNTQPRIVEKRERIVYGGFKPGLDPETYEDCEEC